MDFLSWETNEALINFFTNNYVLFKLIQWTVKYICRKTPWAFDDDLPSFLSGLMDIVKIRKTK